MLFKKTKIISSSWRYRLAQCCLHLLYGHKHMYFSPWKHAAVTVDGIYIYEKKLLIAKRAGDVEDVGLWQIPGGHIDMETGENILEALKRETYEEHQLTIDITKVNVNDPFFVKFNPKRQYIAQEDVSLLGLQYVYELSTDEMESVQISKEATQFKFADIAELEKIKKAGELITDFSYIYPLLK